MTGEGAFPEEIARTQHRHDRFFAGPRQHGDLDAALLDVHDGVARLTLREDDLPFWIGRHAPCRTGGPEEGLSVEGWSFLAWLNAACFRSCHRESSELSHATPARGGGGRECERAINAPGLTQIRRPLEGDGSGGKNSVLRLARSHPCC